MVRILHTSDWHLGKRLERFPRHEEQMMVLNEIHAIADTMHADLVLVAGDLFDTFNPPAESLDLFYRTLKKMSREGTRPVIAIAGNHDMPERIEAPDPLARECGILFSGFPDTCLPVFSLEQKFSIRQAEPGFAELILPGKPPVRILLTPYANELRLRVGLNAESTEVKAGELLEQHWRSLADKYCDDQGVNLMVAHLLFMNEGDAIPEEPEDERPINHIGGAEAIYTSLVPGNIQYVALGHLHRKQLLAAGPSTVAYSGSPLAYSFSEAGQQKYVHIIDLEPGKEAAITAVPLHSGRQLARKRFESMEDAEAWLVSNQESLVELTLVSDTFLSGENRRRIRELHQGVVSIIPEVRNQETSGDPDNRMNHPQQLNIQELFGEFFQSRKGQQPGTDLLDIFREVIAETDEPGQ